MNVMKPGASPGGTLAGAGSAERVGRRPVVMVHVGLDLSRTRLDVHVMDQSAPGSSRRILPLLPDRSLQDQGAASLPLRPARSRSAGPATLRGARSRPGSLTSGNCGSDMI